MNHIVGLSGGKDSTAMALRLRELHPELPFKFICTPTGDEFDDMTAHWKKLEVLLDSKLIRIRRRHKDGRLMTLDTLIEEQSALPNWRQRWCTRILKIEPTIEYIRSHQPALLYVGLRSDEEEREGIYGSEVQSVFPMRNGCCTKHGPWNWTLAHVWSYLNQCEVTIPRRTDCAKCYYQRIAEWKYLWLHYPDKFSQAKDLEHQIGATFRSPTKDKWPASLAELEKLFEAGTRIRSRLPEQASCRVCRL